MRHAGLALSFVPDVRPLPLLFGWAWSCTSLTARLRKDHPTKMSTSGLKAIAPVPKASDFLDIVLSKTQRKTPTVRTLSGRS